MREEADVGPRCILVTMVFIGFAIGGCGSGKMAANADKPEEASLALSLRTESYAHRSIAIIVHLDGKLVFDGDLMKGRPPQASTRREIKLSHGSHTLKAIVAEHNATEVVDFVLDERQGKKWVQISYFYSPGGKYGIKLEPQIDIVVSDERIPHY